MRERAYIDSLNTFKNYASCYDTQFNYCVKDSLTDVYFVTFV